MIVILLRFLAFNVLRIHFLIIFEFLERIPTRLNLQNLKIEKRKNKKSQKVSRNSKKSRESNGRLYNPKRRSSSRPIRTSHTRYTQYCCMQFKKLFFIQIFLKKLNEINANRGRRGTDRRSYVKKLQNMYTIADEQNLGAGILARIILSVISAYFEMNLKLSEAMPFNTWSKYVG